jgi:hypothetical protein
VAIGEAIHARRLLPAAKKPVTVPDQSGTRTVPRLQPADLVATHVGGPNDADSIDHDLRMRHCRGKDCRLL